MSQTESLCKGSSRVELTLYEKSEILKKFDALPKCSQRTAAKLLGISQSSLNCLLRKRHEIVAAISSNSTNVNRKRKRSGKDFVIEHGLLAWYHEAKKESKPVTRSILIKKAEEMAIKHSIANFKATDGWFTRWKARNNVILKNQISEDLLSHNWFSQILPYILGNYTSNQIYNIGKTVLNVKDFELDRNISSDQEQLTIVLTCNMAGDKCVPFIIGKNAYLECLKRTLTLSVHYEISENGDLTGDIFSSFLLGWDKAITSEKIVLLLDVAYIHLENLPLENIKMIFIPSDVISRVQPLDQGIIKTFKSFYKKNIKRKVDDSIWNSENPVDEIMQQVTLLNILHVIADAWKNVTSSCIYSSFIKAGFSNKGDLEEISWDYTMHYANTNSSVHNHDDSVSDHVNENTLENVNESTVKLDKGSIDIQNNLENPCIKTGKRLKRNLVMFVSQQMKENDVADVINCEVTLSESVNENIPTTSEISNTDIVKDTNQNATEDKPVTVEEAQNAIFIIRKTLEQNNASSLCFDLFCTVEKEINKLLKIP